MTHHIREYVDVVTIYNHMKKVVFPYKIRWRGREYKIIKLGYHHRERVGRVLFHIFHVSTSSLAFRLRFDSQGLSWMLEEVSDGTAN